MDEHWLSSDKTEEESTALFPTLSPERGPRISIQERRLLGRNPYTALRERERHRRHLEALNTEQQQKIEEGRNALAARHAQTQALLNPSARVGDADHTQNDAVCVQSAIMAHARRRNPLLPAEPDAQNCGTGKTSGAAFVTALIDTTVPFPHIDPLTAAKEDSLVQSAWPGAPTTAPAAVVDGAGANCSVSSLSKAERHRSYFAPNIVPMNFEDYFQNSSSSGNETFTLDQSVTPDPVILRVLFGTASVDLMRATRTMTGKTEEKDLQCIITGKPPHPWKDDRITVEVSVSSHSFTAKCLTVSAYMRSVPHLLPKLGLSLTRLWSFMPFNLRWKIPDVMDATVSAKYLPKQQVRVFRAITKLGILGGRVMMDATATISGFASSTNPGCRLRLSMIEEPANLAAFSFKKVSLLLHFIDAFPISKIEFIICVMTKSFCVAGIWNVADFLPVRRLMGDEQQVPLHGALSQGHPLCLRSHATRQHFLWSTFHVTKGMAFIEAENGVCRYGVECCLTATIARSELRFAGRFQCMGPPPHEHITFEAPLVGAWHAVYGFPFMTMVNAVLKLVANTRQMEPVSVELSGMLLCGSLALPASVHYTAGNLSQHFLLADVHDTRWDDLVAALQPHGGFTSPSDVVGLLSSLTIVRGRFCFNPQLHPVMHDGAVYHPGFTLVVNSATLAGYHASHGVLCMSPDAQTFVGSIDLDEPFGLGRMRIHSSSMNGQGPRALVSVNVAQNRAFVQANAATSALLPRRDDIEFGADGGPDDLHDGVQLIGHLGFLGIQLPCRAQVQDRAISVWIPNAPIVTHGSSSLILTAELSGPLNSETPLVVSGNPCDADSFDTLELNGQLQGFTERVREHFKGIVTRELASATAELQCVEQAMQAVEEAERKLGDAANDKDSSCRLALDKAAPISAALEEHQHELLDDICLRSQKKLVKVLAASNLNDAEAKLCAQLQWLGIEMNQVYSAIAAHSTALQCQRDGARDSDPSADIGRRAILRGGVHVMLHQRVVQLQTRVDHMERGVSSLAATYRLSGDNARLLGEVNRCGESAAVSFKVAVGRDLTLSPCFFDIVVSLHGLLSWETLDGAAQRGAAELHQAWIGSLGDVFDAQ